MGNPPGNFAEKPVNIQPQMGLLNPQTAIPFSNPSPHFDPNQFFPIQAPQNLNYPIAMNQMNNMNNPQFFNQNPIGPSKFFNQNLNLGFPNQIRDLNQIFQLQMQNFNTQTLPANLNFPRNVAFVGASHPANLNLPQNVGFDASTQLGFVDSSGILQQSMNSNVSDGTPNATQQFQASPSLVQNQKNFHPQPSNFQGNQGHATGIHMTKNNGKGPQYKNFKRNQKHEAPQNGLKPQFHKMQNARGNFSSWNMRLRRGNDHGGTDLCC